MGGSYSVRRDEPGRAGHGHATWRCVRHQAVPDLSGQLSGLCWAEPGQDLSGARAGAERVPAAGGACREDSRITAAAPDAENVLPVLDPRRRAAALSAGPASAPTAPAAR